MTCASNDKTSSMQYSIVCLWNWICLQKNMDGLDGHRETWIHHFDSLHRGKKHLVLWCWIDGCIVRLFWSCGRTKVWWIDHFLLVTQVLFLHFGIMVKFLHYAFHTRRNSMLFNFFFFLNCHEIVFFLNTWEVISSWLCFFVWTNSTF